MPPEPDLNAPFKLLHELGSGSFGTVYLAEQQGALYAFKILRGGQPAAAEVTVAGQLRHPAIATVFGEGVAHSGERGIVCEYVNGPTLRAVLDARAEERKRFEPGELWRLARALARGIDHAHSHTVLHRDLKPANVMLRRWDWHPKIVDFGLACNVGPDGSLAATQSTPGSLYYMPPDIVLDGNPWRGRGDVYAFAAILYEGLEGHSHVFTLPPNQLLYDQLMKALRAYVLLPPDHIPGGAWQVLRRGLARQPDDRPKSALDLLNAFRAAWDAHATAPRPAKALPPDLPVDSGRWPDRLRFADAADMVLVRGQEFLLGHNTAGGPDNQPAHRVRLSPYYIDAYPVTNVRFAAYVADTPNTIRGAWHRYYQPGENDDAPVRGLTWADCAAYCEAYGKRLPTEAEWECAARGGVEGKGRRYPWGDTYAAGFARCGLAAGAGPGPVGLYPPNPLGLFDMAGNVAEWVADWYDDCCYRNWAKSRVVDDPCVSNSGDEARRVTRGGSWAGSAEDVLAVRRRPLACDAAPPDVGFRAVWVPGGARV